MSDPRALPAWLPRAGVAMALLALVALSFDERWRLLTASPFPLGVDGYFYPVQLRALLETGGLQYPASPLTFWLMAPLAAATDPITGAKLGAALFGALIALPAYAVGARLGQGRGAGLIAAVLATTSAGSAYLTIEFVKNGVGLTIFVLAVWLLLRALESATLARIGLAIAGGILALLAHKMAAMLLLLVVVPAVIAEAAGRGVLRGRRLLYVLGGVALVIALVFVLGAVFPQRLPSPTDVHLLREVASRDAAWTAPALVTPRATLRFGYEALLGGGLGVVGALVLW
ncbi:MAG: glycosyltransferase family 39 protein, partial [Myxococcota bacterium]|nr:glycosyltransferase family 39 protein [Myxococcota bacterium]